jgi:hypothetical protein
MARNRILAAWNGHRDLRAFATNCHLALKNEILAVVKGELPPAGEGNATPHDAVAPRRMLA